MQTISNKYVGPIGPIEAKIWFVGEAPGEDEEIAGEPFVGRAGQKLMEVLGRFGIFREDIRLTNLCNYRPTFNNFDFLLNSQELEDGKRELTESIRSNQPVVIVPLGNHALHFLTGCERISKYRGSILKCNLEGCEQIKVIPTFHPSYITRNAEAYPIFVSDIRRIVNDSRFRDCQYPERNYYIAPVGPELEELVTQFEQSPYLACDIETTYDTKEILCHGFANIPSRALVLPHETQYIPYIDRLYRSPAQKIFHYGLFDVPVLTLNGFDVQHWTDDTYVMYHALEPEMPRGLDFLTSLYTREPYYKAQGRGEIPDNTKAWSSRINRDELYIYNAKDCAVTCEISLALQQELATDPTCAAVYRYEMKTVQVALKIGQNGMYINQETRKRLEIALVQQWAKLQTILNTINDGKECNVNSPGKNGQVYKLLMKKLKLPERKKDGKVTVGEDAIVNLIGFCKGKIEEKVTVKSKLEWETKLEACKLILEIRGIRKLLSSYININLSWDGRARSIYNAAGTDTGRWSASKFVDGSGLNPMTLPREAVTIPETLVDLNFDQLVEAEKQFNIDAWISQLEQDLNNDEEAA